MAEEGQVISCHTVEAWNEQLQKGNESKKLKSLRDERGIAKLVSVFIKGLVADWKQEFERSKLSTTYTDNVVVDFTASWCGPCRFMAPILAELAKKLPNVIFLKVDVDELKTVATDWAVEAMPTFMFLKEGKIVDKIVGARKEELQQKITAHMVA